MHLASLFLTRFRNYADLTLRDLSPGLIALTGPNGAGKTNVLEAISLLFPGRGLRHARLEDMQSRGVPVAQGGWGVHAHIEGPLGRQNIGVGLDPATGRRVVHLNGSVLKSAAEQAELIRCVWLTPAQDRLFLESSSMRRKFLDRWVFGADPAHAGRISRLERLLAERNRLLTLDRADPLWLNAVEHDLSETALAVAIARTDYVDRLRMQIDATPADDLFPTPHIALSGFLEDRIGSEPAVAIEQDYRAMLHTQRARDAQFEATSIGPHRSDLHVQYAIKNMPASDCSTGEQKALLFSLFLAHVRLMHAQHDSEAPILLLDEIAAHLDHARRQALLARLRHLGAQVIMTATSADAFVDCGPIEMIEIENGVLKHRPALRMVT